VGLKNRNGSEGSGLRCQVSAPPLGASTQFDRKRNFGRASFIQGFRGSKVQRFGGK